MEPEHDFILSYTTNSSVRLINSHAVPSAMSWIIHFEQKGTVGPNAEGFASCLMNRLYNIKLTYGTSELRGIYWLKTMIFTQLHQQEKGYESQWEVILSHITGVVKSRYQSMLQKPRRRKEHLPLTASMMMISQLEKEVQVNTMLRYHVWWLVHWKNWSLCKF